MMKKAQIVVLPGAWHTPEKYFDAVTTRLKTFGYTVHGRQMPATGNAKPPKDLSEDIAAAQSLVETAIDDGNDVAVVAHSWGGIVAGSALSGYGKKQREAQGKKGGVIAVGYMTAFLGPEGASLMDGIGHQTPYWFNEDAEKGVVYATDPKIFYNDLPEDERQHWHSLLQSQSISSFYAPTTAASWKEIPTHYLVCEEDIAIPVAAQDGMIQAARDAGVEVEVTRLDSGHSPFLSKPDETAAWIRKVAGEAA